MPKKRVVRDHNNELRIAYTAELKKHLKAKGGIRAIANAMTDPMKTTMDLEAKMRAVFALETNWAPEFPFQYAPDLDRTPAVKTAKGGGVFKVDLDYEEVRIDDSIIQHRVYVGRDRLFRRVYDVVSRAQERLNEGMGIRESLILLELLDASATSGYGHAPVVTAGALDKATLSHAVDLIDTQHIPMNHYLYVPSGEKGIRRITRDHLDEKGLQETRESGSLGQLWGASFIKEYLIEPSSAFVNSDPEYIGTYFIRADQLVDAITDVEKARVGFVGYHMYGAAVHNAKGTVKVTFDPTA